MKRGLNPKGFTIVETMIFLAVSAAVLASALALVSGSQNRTAFSQAMNDVNQQMTTLANNVANGYYPRSTNLQCTINSGSVEVKAGSKDRGTESNCIFIGRVAQFYKTEDYFTVYSIAGARQTGGVIKREVGTLGEARASAITLIAPDKIPLQSGIKIEKVTVNGGDIGAVGFFTSFGETLAGQLQSGALKSNFVGLAGSSISGPPDNIDSLIKSTGFRSDYDSNSSTKNPVDGIRLCFASGTTNEKGVITIGGAGKSATSTLVIGDSCNV